MAIELHYFPSPNGRKVGIALEEMGLRYAVAFVDIFNNDQLRPDFLKISPNGRIPAMVDTGAAGERIEIFESGAILQYLGRKSGLFYPLDEAQRCRVDGWLFWQMAGLGPMTGQASYFTRAAGKPGRDPRDCSYAIHRYLKETRRLYGVLDRQLMGRAYVCDAYSIADMACWPWIDQYHGLIGNLADYPALADWHRRIAARPAVRRALQLGMDRVGGASR